jgi:hypothetical protein
MPLSPLAVWRGTTALSQDIFLIYHSDKIRRPERLLLGVNAIKN